MHFIPTTPDEEIQLLRGSGVKTFSDLIETIPKKLRLGKDLGLGEPLSELEIEKELRELSISNKPDCCNNTQQVVIVGVPEVILINFLSC